MGNGVVTDGMGAKWRAALPGTGTEVNRLVEPASGVAFWCHRLSPYTGLGTADNETCGHVKFVKGRANVHHLEPGPGQDRSPPEKLGVG